jgi:hypothetical protein
MWRIQYTLYVRHPGSNGIQANGLQIGFLTEWQMYAQKLEGESWKGERMDMAKVEKMSGMHLMDISLHAQC